MKGPSRIVCAVDFSEPSAHAMNHAMAWAKRLHLPMVIVHVLEPLRLDPRASEFVFASARYPVPDPAELEARALSLLNRLKSRSEREGVPASIELLRGPAGTTLAAHLTEMPGSWLVMGTRGYRGLSRFMLGSTTAELLRRACCPVLAVQERHPQRPIRQIGVGVDFSAAGMPAVDTAAWLARKSGARLHLIHILAPLEANYPPETLLPFDMALMHEASRTAARSALQAFAEAHLDLDVACSVMEGTTPYRQLARYARDESLDLLALGTHGRSAFTRALIGTVAERVLQLSPCPVLGVRPPDELPIELDADDV